MRYSPRSSVTAERTFSIKTGLEASTVTPGKTAPDVSVTSPEIVAALVPWLAAGDGRRSNARTRRPRLRERYMGSSFPRKRDRDNAGPPGTYVVTPKAHHTPRINKLSTPECGVAQKI